MKAHLTFGGLLRSEWIKLWSVRATWWLFPIAIVVTVLISLALPLVVVLSGGDSETTREIGGGDANALLVGSATSGIGFSQLVLVVLGALVITGEFGTGMIRSTFLAAPGRTSAVLAKALVFAITTFVIGFLAVLLSAAIDAPILAGAGAVADFSDGQLWAAFLGASGYLALLSLLALAFGLLIRNTAGSIATVLGLVLVLPNIINILSALLRQAWTSNLSELLPSTAGNHLYTYGPGLGTALALPGAWTIEPWGGGLILAAWVVVVGVVGLVLVKRRDV
jgi:ABC-2 type transport system permease protein